MAVATAHLLYAPMPLAGSDWVEQVLVRCGGVPILPGKKFTPVAEIPPIWLKDRVLLGSIRDPWSWYLALWQVLSAKSEHQVLLRHLGRGRPTFPAFLQGVTDSSTWMTVVQRFALWDIPVGSDGLYTETFRTIYDGGHGLGGLIDFAQIEAGLSEVLETPITGFTADRLANPYTPETEDLVHQADGVLATSLGYTGPFSRLLQPVRWGGL